MMEQYTADSIQVAVAKEEPKLFAAWSAGRPEGWKCDTQTHDVICIGNWMTEQLSKLIAENYVAPNGVTMTDEDRILQQLKFNRWSRSRTDLFVLAAEIMNEAIAGLADRERKPHHRWG